MAASGNATTQETASRQPLDLTTLKALSQNNPAVVQYARDMGLDLSRPEDVAELNRAKKMAGVADATTTATNQAKKRRSDTDKNLYGVSRARRNDGHPMRYFHGVKYT